MAEDSKKNEAMVLEQAKKHYATYLGSPSHGPPELERSTEEVNSDHDEIDEEEDEEVRATFRREKDKTKVSTPEGEDDDKSDDGELRKVLGTAKGNSKATPTTAATDADIEIGMDTYWAGAKTYDVAGQTFSPLPAPIPRFGDADAAMNDALYSSSYPFSPVNQTYDQNTPRAPPTPVNSPSGPVFSSELSSKLESLQLQQQQQGPDDSERGRERSWGEGWDLRFQDRVARGTDDDDCWVAAPSSPAEQPEGVDWEVYDEAAWERAAAKQETQTVTLKLPLSSNPVKKRPGTMNLKFLNAGSVEKEVGARKKEVGARKKEVGAGAPDVVRRWRKRRDLVRAVRAYKAILTGNYLSYEKDDVLEVMYRDRDGRWDDVFFPYVVGHSRS